MANFNLYVPLLEEAEGGYVNHPSDPGGHTNKGWTLSTYKQVGFDNDGDGVITLNDLKLLTTTQSRQLYKTHFWDKMRASEINSQSLANTYVDHGINAGPARSIKMMQYVLINNFGKDIALDGAIGPQTIGAINSVNAKQLTADFNNLRIDYYYYRANFLDKVFTPVKNFLSTMISPRNSAKSFINGWINRVKKHAYVSTIVGGGVVATIGFFLPYI
jgi:lysozyme family protein